MINLFLLVLNIKKLYTEVYIMAKIALPEKAYKNLDFLSSSDARTIRILSELYEPQSRFKKNNIVDTIVFFGSARIQSKRDAQKALREFKKITSSKGKKYIQELARLETQVKMSRYYEDTVELSKKLTEWSLALPTDQKRFTVTSGGGPGIMEAANKGASLAKGDSIGLNISIPFEQFVNKYVKPELAFEFHYFFMRKFWFMYLAKALVVFPGGFGTLDELMEVLTLIQTEKSTKATKIVVYDEEYWKRIINFDALIEFGTISASDMKLLTFCNNVDDTFKEITNHLTTHYLKSKKNKKNNH